MIGLFFGGQAFQLKFGNDFGNIELDANLEETHEWGADVTENPVEEGAPVADHVIERADKLTVRGFVSESPVTASPNILGLIGSVSDASSRTQQVFDLLRLLIKEKATMTVYTKHLTYDDMVLTGLRIPRTPADGQAIEFVADFVHVRFVEAQSVDVPNGISAKGKTADDATVRKTSPAKDAGKKGATDSTAAAAKKPPTSFLKGMLD